MAGGVIVAYHVGDDVRPPAPGSIFGFDQATGGVITEIAPVNNVVVPIAPPGCVVPVPDVVVKNLCLAASRDPRFHVASVIVYPALRAYRAARARIGHAQL